MAKTLKQKLIRDGEMIKMKKCKYCGSKENLSIDHKLPIAKGGKNEKKNLQCLCKRCNGTKSKLTDGEVRKYFRWFLQIQKDRVNNGKKPFQLF